MRWFREHLSIVVPCLVTLAYLLLLTVGMFGKNHGLPVALQVRRECDRLKNDIHTYEQQNAALKREFNRLNDDSRYLEKLARENLNMLSDNELVFVFSE